MEEEQPLLAGIDRKPGIESAGTEAAGRRATPAVKLAARRWRREGRRRVPGRSWVGGTEE